MLNTGYYYVLWKYKSVVWKLEHIVFTMSNNEMQNFRMEHSQKIRIAENLNII